jgi:hypothetical protein
LTKLFDVPSGISRERWIFENMRVFVVEITHYAGGLEPYCSKNTCPAMNAGKLAFMCATHQPPFACSAVDYMSHTLETTWTMLNNRKIFPPDAVLRAAQIEPLKGLARRLYRVFVHVFFQHKELFEQLEAKGHLHWRFKEYTRVFSLMSPDNYIENLQTTLAKK